jgi:hypothetical protein
MGHTALIIRSSRVQHIRNISKGEIEHCLNSVNELAGTPRPISEWVVRDIEGMGQCWKKDMGPTCVIEALLGDVRACSNERIKVDIFLLDLSLVQALLDCCLRRFRFGWLIRSYKSSN